MDNRIVVGYARVSTDEQFREGFSIDAQVDKMKLYAQLQGWMPVEMFIEEGESAKDMNRTQLKKIMGLIKKGKVAAVMTVAVDRMCRNLLDMLQFIDLCERHNTAYVCTSLNFDTSTPIGRMILQILAAFAEFERAMIATRVRSTMLDISDKQARHMSTPPFGYRHNEEKRLEIVPEEAHVITEIVDMFLAGLGYRAITKALNDKGVIPRKAKTWNGSSIRQVLTNEAYVGRLVYNRRFYGKDGKQQWRNESDWIVKDNAHPAIISEEKWNRIQSRIQKIRPGGGTKSAKHRLSGLFKCGHCGSSMGARNHYSKGPKKGKVISFICHTYAKSGGCWFNYGFESDAEEAVLQLLQEYAEGQFDISTVDTSDIHRNRELEYERREHALDMRFQKQIEAFEKGLISERDLKLARERIERERETLAEERARISDPGSNVLLTNVQKSAKHALWLWEHGELPALHLHLRSIIDSIVITDRQVSDINLAKTLLDF